MDAYDIFKKLTKGLKFKNPVQGKIIDVKSTKLPPVKKEEAIKIKDEVLSEEEANESQSEEEGSHSESEQTDGEIQLVDGVTVGKKKKKKKKEKTEDLKKKLELEEQNHFRNTYGIRTVGRHIPAALRDFDELKTRYNVSDTLINTIRECGYTEPTPIQRQAIACMMEDRQMLACAPTGSGKTAAFLVPLVASLGAAAGGPRALVLCPTRELALQLLREALRLTAGGDLRCSVVRKVHASKLKEREATVRRSDIVISTPNRLCYLLDQENVNINLDKVRWLVLDEADKLFEGSEDAAGDFRQQVGRVLAACGGRARRVAMFSATHAPPAARWARRELRGLINVTVGQRNAASALVRQELTFCGSEAGKLVAFRQLLQAGVAPPVLVFVQSKERAKELFKELIYDGVNVDVLHADRTQLQRENVITAFRTGAVWVLICTELAARGLDFRAVGLVVNYDFPPSAVAYVHRIGRTGRAGVPGRAVTFFTQDDVANLRSIAAVLNQSGCAVPEYMLRLRQSPAARRRLRTSAPRRDRISTILGKRKPEEPQAASDAQPTDKVSDSKHKKHRKVEKNNNNKNRVKTPPQAKGRPAKGKPAKGKPAKGKPAKGAAGGKHKKQLNKKNKTQLAKKVKKI